MEITLAATFPPRNSLPLFIGNSGGWFGPLFWGGNDGSQEECFLLPLTLPETNSLSLKPLKIDSWKMTIVSFWVSMGCFGLFSRGKLYHLVSPKYRFSSSKKSGSSFKGHPIPFNRPPSPWPWTSTEGSLRIHRFRWRHGSRTSG